MRRSKVAKAVVTVAAGVAVAAMGGQIMPDNLHANAAGVTRGCTVGRITPVNLHANPTDFSDDTAMQQCCGPYAQPCDFKCVAPN